MKKLTLVALVLLSGLGGPLQPAHAQETLPLLKALAQARVRATSAGDGLERVSLTLSRLGAPLFVVVPVGTLFVNSGAAQDMVTISPMRIDLSRSAAVTVSVPAVCANFHKPEPSASSSFSIQAAPEDDELQRLLAVIERRHPSQVVAQVAVWAVTDDVSRRELDSTYTSSFSPFLPGPPAASQQDIQRARELLEEAGIDTTRLALYGR